MEDAPRPDWPWCLPLRARDGHVRAWALVDATDYARLREVRCSLTSRGYVLAMIRGTGGAGRQEYLHRVVAGLIRGDGLVADHENGDRLDNRRGNLRVCTQAQNRQNVASYGKTSAHRGVCFDKSRGNWIATIGRKHLGRFPTELEAARTAADYRRQHMAFAVDR